MNYAIETESLSRSYGSAEAVRQLSLAVPAGSIYAFLGPNGAGKTTTIKTLMNILAPSAGKARVLDVDSRQLGPRELARIGYVSENQKLPEWMTVSQFTEYCRPMYPQWDPVFCEKLRAMFDLPPDRKLKQLSRGMKVKAALLTSLAYRPELLVMDEPFTGLDPLVREEVVRGILELSEQGTWTVFISSHDIDEVERLADWVGVINAGKLALSEPAADLQTRFRRVEFIVPGLQKLPAALPAEWLAPETAGQSVRFIHSRYDAQYSPVEIKQRFPDAADITVQPMTLREIFLALARTFRLNG